MKKRVLAAVIAVVFLFSGCSYSQTGIEGLMAPPKLSDQQNEIYNALVSSVGKNIKLKYPRQGDFTSAFLINNIDNEPTQEALVFYENTANPSVTMPLRISVLDQEDGKWISKYEVAVKANEVEKVSFITKNKQTSVVIGFNLLSKAEKMIVMYTYKDGMLSEQFTTNCSNYEVLDIDDDKSSEIITFIQKIGEGEIKSMTAYMHRINSGGTEIVSQTKMDPNVTEYAKIQKGKLTDGRPALYLDGLKGTSLCTEILAYSDNEIENVIYNKRSSKNLISKTARTYGSFCVDLNKDGVIEIPTLRLALGYEHMQQYEQLYLTEWYNYKDKNLEPIKTTYVSYTLGYNFTIPKNWIDEVTIESIPNSNEISFYEYDRKLLDEFDSKLLSIKVVKRADYEKDALNKGYSLLKDNGQLMYTYKLHQTSSGINLREDEIFKYFELL
ncbi:MAG: hypothetical protein WAX04_07340 [Oscillospiraceae bacterium]